MDNDPRFVNGSFPFKLNGKEFSASMLTDRDIADLTGYIQAKYLETARNSGREVYRFAIASVEKVTWYTTEGMELIGTNEGTMRVGWQMIKQRHPDITFDEFLALLPKERNQRDAVLEKVVETYNYLHRAGDAPTGAGKSS